MTTEETPPLLPLPTLARIIQSLSVTQLLALRELLSEGGDPAGVGAMIPPNLPLREDGIALELPEDYWETAE